MSKTILDIKDLCISFDGFKALSHVYTSVKEGEIRFFIGPNGAGKTTLLDAICGRIKPTSGQIMFHGNLDVTRFAEHELVNVGIGRKFQVPSVFGSLTVYENMELAVQKKRGILASLFREETPKQHMKIAEVLQLTDLTEFVNFPAAELSHGQKQWLEIAMLIVQDLKLILLDEPVAGMGRRETTKTGELLKKIAKQCTVIVVEHDMEFVREYATSVTVLHEGHILDEGDVAAVQANPKVIEVYLGRGGEQCA
jgi:urea transport system ATP-binding protein